MRQYERYERERISGRNPARTPRDYGRMAYSGDDRVGRSDAGSPQGLDTGNVTDFVKHESNKGLFSDLSGGGGVTFKNPFDGSGMTADSYRHSVHAASDGSYGPAVPAEYDVNHISFFDSSRPDMSAFLDTSSSDRNVRFSDASAAHQSWDYTAAMAAGDLGEIGDTVSDLPSKKSRRSSKVSNGSRERRGSRESKSRERRGSYGGLDPRDIERSIQSKMDPDNRRPSAVEFRTFLREVDESFEAPESDMKQKLEAIRNNLSSGAKRLVDAIKDFPAPQTVVQGFQNIGSSRVKVEIKQGFLGYDATFTMSEQDWWNINNVFSDAHQTGYDQGVEALQGYGAIPEGW